MTLNQNIVFSVGFMFFLCQGVMAQYTYEGQSLDLPHGIFSPLNSNSNYDIDISERFTAAGGTMNQPGLSFSSRVNSKSYHVEVNLDYVDQQANTQAGYSSVFSANARPLDNSKEVGAIPAQDGVDALGGFNYSIPIQLPPGSNGVKPSLSVSYSSNGGGGILGPGWSFSGVAAISRTSKNEFYDGITEPVMLDATDPYSLNGSRLVRVGSVYKPVVEDYSVLIPMGGTATSPDYWSVELRNGTVMEYGNAALSKVDHNGITMSWLLNRSTDINGNYIEYKYRVEDGQTLLDEIWYTGNGMQAPYNKVKLVYTRKEHRVKRYFKGHETRDWHLLDRIITFSHGSPILEYQFSYQTTTERYKDFNNVEHITDFGMSVLKEVGLKSLIGGEEFNSTIFQYNDGLIAAKSLTKGASGSIDLNQRRAVFVAGDFNNDGLSDIGRFRMTDNTNTATIESLTPLINTGSGFSSGQTNSTFTNASSINMEDYWDAHNKILRSTDLDNDGDDDLLIAEATGGSIYVKRLLNGVTDNSTYMQVPNLFYDVAMGDFTGDGIPDGIAYFTNGQPFGSTVNTYGAFILKDFANQTFGTQHEQSMYAQPLNYPYNDIATTFRDMELTPFDYDGDGTVELLFWKEESGNIIFKVLDIVESPVNSGNWSLQPLTNGGTFVGFNGYDNIQPGDFNGDGISDFVAFSTNDGTFSGSPYRPRLKVYHGDGTSHMKYLNIDYKKSDRWFFLDVNSDGFSDLVRLYEKSGDTGVKLFYSNGVDFTEASYRDITDELSEMKYINFGDFNGNNALEMFYSTQTFVQLNVFPYTNELRVRTAIIDFASGPKAFKLHKVRNGLNQDIEVKYAYNSDPTEDCGTPDCRYGGTFRLGDAATDPSLPDGTIYLNQQLLAVSEIKRSIAPGFGTREVTERFAYGPAVFNKNGKGFLGVLWKHSKQPFKQLLTAENSVFDPTCNCLLPENRLKINLISFTHFPNVSKVYEKVSFTHSVTAIMNGKWHLIQPTQTVVEDFVQGSKTTKNNTYYEGGILDGNLKKVVIDNGIYVTTKEYTSYGQFGTNRFEHPTEIEHYADNLSHPGQYYTKTTFSYDASGNLTQKTTNAHSSKAVTEQYTYNVFGSILSTSTSSNGLPTITEFRNFDQYGQFLEWSENAKGQKTRFTTWKPFGVPLRIETPDGNAGMMTYNGFGRKIKAKDPNNITTIYELAWNDQGSFPDPAELYYEAVSKPGEPEVKLIFDFLKREVRSETQGWDDLIVTTNEYWVAHDKDPFLVKKKQLPFLLNTPGSPSFVEFEYDDLNRQTTVTHPTQGTQTITYSPLLILNIGDPFPVDHKYKTTVVAFNGESSSSSINAAGELVEATDNGGTLTYAYNDQGAEIEVKLNSTVMTVMEYDPVHGAQTKLIDANAGTTQYSYDSYGNLTSQWDAKGTTTYTYNSYNELQLMTNPLGTVTYTYVNSGNGLNQVSSVVHSNGSEDHYQYDAFGRNTITNKKVNGEVFTYKFIYDDLGKMVKQTFPSGFEIGTEYTASGHLKKVTDASSGNLIWKGLEMDRFGNYTQIEMGDGEVTDYVFTETGLPSQITNSLLDLEFSFDANSQNLLTYEDHENSVFEDYGYDNLDRLTSMNLNGSLNRQVTYASNGNILSKGKLDDYSYQGGKPNALTGVRDPHNLISDEEQLISYNALQQPSVIQEDNYELTLAYGSDGQRITSELRDNGSLIRTRIHLPGFDKQVFHDDNVTQEIHYISGGHGMAAIYVIENGVGKMHFAYADYLGSILKTTDINGDITAEQSFDAWGRKRNPTDWTYDLEGSLPNWLFRGYTGHEHYDEFELINMNGRMYDPMLGRMLSADNHVQSPSNTQSYNRYAYVFNNPLKYTDPNGEIAWFVPVIGFAVLGGWVGGAIQQGDGGLEGANFSFWGGKSGKWDNTAWKGVTVGALVGAAVGFAVTYGIGAANASQGFWKLSGGYTDAGATKAVWNILVNGVMTANVNMGSRLLQGGDWTDVAESGLIGFGAGAIGGAYASQSKYATAATRNAMNTQGIKAQNYVTNILNGAGDRFLRGLNDNLSNSQLVMNTIAGGTEGFLSAKLLTNENTMFRSTRSMDIGKGFSDFKNPVFGRYLTSFVTNGVTSNPGASFAIARAYASVWPTFISATADGESANIFDILIPSLGLGRITYKHLYGTLQESTLSNYPYAYPFLRP